MRHPRLKQRAQPRLAASALQRGMSLIEIIIVIVLIGGILALVGSRLVGGKGRADYNLAKTQVGIVSGKVDSYQIDTGRYPTTLMELVQSDAPGWLGPYAKDNEVKDPWGTAFEYRVPGTDGKPFDLVSLGADRKPGGTSTDADITHE